jgi:hypothetical protein
MEPALPSGIPGDGEALKAATRELDEILLERRDAERIADLEVGRLAGGSLRVDEELAVSLEKPRRHAAVVHADVVEISAHCLGGGGLHRQVVMRARPLPVLRRVALGAGGALDVCDWNCTGLTVHRRRELRHRRERLGLRIEPKSYEDRHPDQGDHGDEDNDAPPSGSAALGRSC